MPFNMAQGDATRGTDSIENDSIEIDRETLHRIDYALDGTIDVDLSNLSVDDKLTLLIERYNRKLRQIERSNISDQ
jgi:hypothetical protein